MKVNWPVLNKEKTVEVHGRMCNHNKATTGILFHNRFSDDEA